MMQVNAHVLNARDVNLENENVIIPIPIAQERVLFQPNQTEETQQQEDMPQTFLATHYAHFEVSIRRSQRDRMSTVLDDSVVYLGETKFGVSHVVDPISSS